MISALAATLLLAAAAPQDNAIEQARQHAVAGNRAFDLGRYDEAIEEFQKAYLLKDVPALLYNIGQAYRLSSRPAEAMRFYGKYLDKSPNAPNREDVEQKIEALAKVVEAQKKSLNARPNDPIGDPGQGAPQGTPAGAMAKPVSAMAPREAVTATPVPSGWRLRDTAWVVGGAGAAMLVGGALFALKASSAASELTAAAAAHQAFDPSVESTGRNSQALSRVLLAGGAAALGTGVTLFLLSRPVSVQAAPSGASARVSF